MTRKKLRVLLAGQIRLLTGLKFVVSQTIARHAVKTNGAVMPEGVDGVLCLIDGWDMANQPILTSPIAVGPRGECHLAGTIRSLLEK